MSRENVEFLEGLLRGVPEMDKQALLDALPELIPQACDPEIEWVEDPRRPDRRVYHGHEGVRQSWERWLENFDEYGAELERIVDCGEKVLVVMREEGRGSLSGATISQRNYSVYTFRDGKILRYEEFYDEQDALDAAGVAGEQG
jgi:ketosteroid isomerase-like protein